MCFEGPSILRKSSPASNPSEFFPQPTIAARCSPLGGRNETGHQPIHDNRYTRRGFALRCLESIFAESGNNRVTEPLRALQPVARLEPVREHCSEQPPYHSREAPLMLRPSSWIAVAFTI